MARDYVRDRETVSRALENGRYLLAHASRVRPAISPRTVAAVLLALLAAGSVAAALKLPGTAYLTPLLAVAGLAVLASAALALTGAARKARARQGELDLLLSVLPENDLPEETALMALDAEWPSVLAELEGADKEMQYLSSGSAEWRKACLRVAQADARSDVWEAKFQDAWDELCLALALLSNAKAA